MNQNNLSVACLEANFSENKEKLSFWQFNVSSTSISGWYHRTPNISIFSINLLISVINQAQNRVALPLAQASASTTAQTELNPFQGRSPGSGLNGCTSAALLRQGTALEMNDKPWFNKTMDKNEAGLFCKSSFQLFFLRIFILDVPYNPNS